MKCILGRTHLLLTVTLSPGVPLLGSPASMLPLR